MRITIAAIGRLKDGPDRTLFQTYADRLNALGRAHALGPLTVHELPESRTQTATLRKEDEAERLQKLLADTRTVIALDERGRTYDSTTFADLIRNMRDDGAKSLAFVIGGPDGLATGFAKRARMTLSLGPMTLPHGLARIVLAEQLYRAATIIAGHPYHRA